MTFCFKPSKLKQRQKRHTNPKAQTKPVEELSWRRLVEALHGIWELVTLSILKRETTLFNDINEQKHFSIKY